MRKRKPLVACHSCARTSITDGYGVTSATLSVGTWWTEAEEKYSGTAVGAVSKGHLGTRVTTLAMTSATVVPASASHRARLPVVVSGPSSAGRRRQMSLRPTATMIAAKIETCSESRMTSTLSSNGSSKTFAIGRVKPEGSLSTITSRPQDTIVSTTTMAADSRIQGTDQHTTTTRSIRASNGMPR